MFKGRKLKILVIYVLICCFLVNNLIFIASSEASDADTSGNTTEPSEYPGSSYEAQTEGTLENLQPEVSETPESTGDELSDISETGDQETQTPENTGLEELETQTPDSPKEQDPEPGTGQDEATDAEGIPEDTGNADLENKGNISGPENESGNKTYEPAEVSAGTSTESEKGPQTTPSEEKETESSHHKSSGTSQYKVKKAEAQTKNEANVQTEPLNPDLSKASREAPPSASVNLHGEKTDVVAGEDILLKLSAVNLITRPVMHVQVIIIPPSGLSVSSSEFVQSGAGQYTTTYELEPGQGRDIEVRIETNQPGDFNVQGRVVYYFGENTKKLEDYTLQLPITVRDKSDFSQTAAPGFELVNAVGIILAVFLYLRKK